MEKSSHRLFSSNTLHYPMRVPLCRRINDEGRDEWKHSHRFLISSIAGRELLITTNAAQSDIASIHVLGIYASFTFASPGTGDKLGFQDIGADHAGQ